jgi:hypothetical protein
LHHKVRRINKLPIHKAEGPSVRIFPTHQGG